MLQLGTYMEVEDFSINLFRVRVFQEQPKMLLDIHHIKRLPLASFPNGKLSL
jgi:hypothetical protein